MPAGPITTREDAEGDAVREFTPRDASRTYAGAADDPFARLDLKPGETSVDPYRPRVNNPLGFLKRMMKSEKAQAGAPEFADKPPVSRMKEYLRDPALVTHDPAQPFGELAERDRLIEQQKYKALWGGQDGPVNQGTWTTFMFGERRRRLAQNSNEREQDDHRVLGTCPLSSSLAACEWRVVDESEIEDTAFPPRNRINIAFKS
ncbi:hypothetical protein RI054_35g135700 [Pseudoscourfieldia marina]|uniref:Uncharacterized protein n=2 Tax=Pycnococcus provasolii TaxID=41880 RepID=A0A7S2YYX5_9CHLO|mmetsp:Transcript_4119/g.10290  ORF Transcript_4119/g.10290 Transcript_4119/m.10290 type:complete len:204 (+) Transcript_4119:39-650(+)